LIRVACLYFSFLVSGVYILPSFAMEELSVNAINKECDSSSKQCLSKVEIALKKQKPDTDLWYELIRIKLDNLFDLTRNEQLYHLTKSLVERKGLPQDLRIKVLIYHTKMMSVFSSKKERDHFRGLAEVYLRELTENTSDPQLLMTLVNLQLYSERSTRAAYNILRKIEKQYKQKNDPAFKFELYSNLGHFAVKLKLFNDLIAARTQAVYWAKKANNDLDISVAYYNLGRGYDVISNFDMALQHYKNSIPYAEAVNDFVGIALAQLFIAKLYSKEHKSLSTDWFNKINPKHIPKSAKEIYQSLKISIIK